jgi:predicted nuclease of predicted toxin-antitoxin system
MPPCCKIAAAEQCILITIDTDLGMLVFLQGAAHAGVIRLPDVPAPERITLMQQVLGSRAEAELGDAIITVSRNRMRFFAAADPICYAG